VAMAIPNIFIKQKVRRRANKILVILDERDKEVLEDNAMMEVFFDYFSNSWFIAEPIHLSHFHIVSSMVSVEQND